MGYNGDERVACKMDFFLIRAISWKLFLLLQLPTTAGKCSNGSNCKMSFWIEGCGYAGNTETS
jgi:hypothetical protein